MAPILADRVRETTTTTGTGTLSLLGPLSAKYQAFDVAGSGATVPYFIEHQSANEWESGEGVITAGSPDTLSRAVVRSSSNSNNPVNFSAGTKHVFLQLSAYWLQRFGNHSTLDNLELDTHPQYHNNTRGDARYYTQTQLDVFLAAKSDTGHTHSHGTLTNLEVDDHLQYHTDARGDARYYTQSQLDTFLASKSDTSHTHAAADITSGTVATARLGSGTADATTFLRGDQTWQAISGGVTDHGTLTGLADDDHAQYALLAGRATPQTLAFGSASGATAGYLTSTSHATKGKYALNAAGTIVVDEANGRVGVGTASPATKLTINGVGYTTGDNADVRIISAPGSGGAGINLDATQSGGRNYLLASRQVGSIGFYDVSAGAYVFDFDHNSFETLNVSASNAVGAGLSLRPVGGRVYDIISTVGGGAGANKLVIYDSAAASYRMVLDSSGDVGIGTTLPGARLHVTTTAATIGQIIQGIASQTAPLLQLQGISSTAAVRERANIDAIAVDNTDATRKYAIVLSPWDTAAREGMRLWADGSAGRVAITAPASAPTDAHLANGQISAYLDESGHNLVIRAKYSDGTLKTVTLPLT